MKKLYKETHQGLRPLSMLPKTYGIVVGSILMDILVGRIIFWGVMKGTGSILVSGFWIMTIMPVAVVLLWFNIYEAVFGLESVEGSRKQDKPFMIAFFATYFALPYLIALILELHSGHTEFLKGTGLFIQMFIVLAVIYLIFAGLDYLRFNAFKKEYMKSKALASPVVMAYISEKYPYKDIRTSERYSAVPSRLEAYDNYEMNYKDFIIFPFTVEVYDGKVIRDYFKITKDLYDARF